MHTKKQPGLDQEQELLILPLPGNHKGIQMAQLKSDKSRVELLILLGRQQSIFNPGFIT